MSISKILLGVCKDTYKENSLQGTSTKCFGLSRTQKSQPKHDSIQDPTICNVTTPAYWGATLPWIRNLLGCNGLSIEHITILFPQLVSKALYYPSGFRV